MDFINALNDSLNYTRTENDAVALRSTMNPVLDAFSSLGAMRQKSDQDIINVFKPALMADREKALRLLFYIRDIRGGQGERRVFRVLARWLVDVDPDAVFNNLDNFLYYGRADDLFCLLDTEYAGVVFAFIRNQLMMDHLAEFVGKPCSLLAKWMPSENASSAKTKALAKRFAHELGMSMKEYRETLVRMRKYIDITEAKMSAREFDAIQYENVPSRASMIYANAFNRHDGVRYKKYLEDVALGKLKVNANALFPVDIVHRVLSGRLTDAMKSLLDLQWKALPNYLEGTEETGICVVDVSGSMSGEPIEVALSLGIYNADKCRGPFHGKFITFSSRPQVQSIRGENIFENVQFLGRADWEMNTNIEAVFDAILETAIRNGCSQSDIPSKVYIISDMQFDEARGVTGWFGRRVTADNTGKTLMDGIRNRYAEYGYVLPSIVYWNVRQSECGMYQQKYNGVDCCMVSGYSPSLFESVIKGTEYVQENGQVKQKLDPIKVMDAAIMSERYDRVRI